MSDDTFPHWPAARAAAFRAWLKVERGRIRAGLAANWQSGAHPFFVWPLLVLALLAPAAACAQSSVTVNAIDPGTINIDVVTDSARFVNRLVGDTLTFEAAATLPDGTTVDAVWAWDSSNPDVFQFADGLASGLGMFVGAGTAVVTPIIVDIVRDPDPAPELAALAVTFVTGTGTVADMPPTLMACTELVPGACGVVCDALQLPADPSTCTGAEEQPLDLGWFDLRRYTTLEPATLRRVG